MITEKILPSGTYTVVTVFNSNMPAIPPMYMEIGDIYFAKPFVAGKVLDTDRMAYLRCWGIDDVLTFPLAIEPVTGSTMEWVKGQIPPPLPANFNEEYIIYIKGGGFAVASILDLAAYGLQGRVAWHCKIVRPE